MSDLRSSNIGSADRVDAIPFRVDIVESRRQPVAPSSLRTLAPAFDSASRARREPALPERPDRRGDSLAGFLEGHSLETRILADDDRARAPFAALYEFHLEPGTGPDPGQSVHESC